MEQRKDHGIGADAERQREDGQERCPAAAETAARRRPGRGKESDPDMIRASRMPSLARSVLPRCRRASARLGRRHARAARSRRPASRGGTGAPRRTRRRAMAAPEIDEAAEGTTWDQACFSTRPTARGQPCPVRFFVGEAAPADGGDGVEAGAAVVLGHAPRRLDPAGLVIRWSAG